MDATHRWPRVPGVLALSIALTLFLPSCSDGGTGPGPEPAANSVDAYVNALPAWSQFSPPLADFNDIVSDASESHEIVGTTTYRCTTSPYTITQTPDKIVTMDPDVNILWLGALLQGRGYRDGIGSLAEWSVRERAPLRISIDLLAGGNSAVVEHPDLASVNQAVGALIQQATAAGHRGGSSVSYSMQRTHSDLQAGIGLGLSTRYFGPTVRLSVQASRNASETTITAYFVQRMFTASIVLPNTPGDLFSSDFTPARLAEERDRGHVSSSNIPVYVASIVYGRSLLFSFTSNVREDSIRLALSAGKGEDSLGLSARLRNILESSRIGVVTIGGEGRNATDLIKAGQLADYFNEDAALSSARPISYTVRNLGDNSIAKVSETTEYNLKECEAVATTGDLVIDVTPNDASVSIVGPNDYTFGPATGDQYRRELEPGGYTITVSHDGYETSTTDVSVAAGDEIQHPITLRASNQEIHGAIYRITPQRLTIGNASCTGESEADVFHTITMNDSILTNRPEGSSIPLYAGGWDDESKGSDFWGPPVTDTVWFEGTRNKLFFHAVVQDADLNAPDPMSNSSWTYLAPNIPEGPITKPLNLQGASCYVTFQFDVTKVADMFTEQP